MEQHINDTVSHDEFSSIFPYMRHFPYYFVLQHVKFMLLCPRSRRHVSQPRSICAVCSVKMIHFMI